MTAQTVTDLGSDAIPACGAVKTLHIKEPAEAQKDEEGEGEHITFLLIQNIVLKVFKYFSLNYFKDQSKLLQIGEIYHFKLSHRLSLL